MSKLSIVNVNNPFLNVNKVSLEDIKSLLNHNVWIRIKDNDDVYESVCNIKDISENTICLNDLIYERVIDIRFNDVVGLLDITDSLCNDINYKKYVDKMVKITNFNDDSIECLVEDYDEYLIYFAVNVDDNLSYDLSYPINLVKAIEIIEG